MASEVSLCHGGHDGCRVGRVGCRMSQPVSSYVPTKTNNNTFACIDYHEPWVWAGLRAKINFCSVRSMRRRRVSLLLSIAICTALWTRIVQTSLLACTSVLLCSPLPMAYLRDMAENTREFSHYYRLRYLWTAIILTGTVKKKSFLGYSPWTRIRYGYYLNNPFKFGKTQNEGWKFARSLIIRALDRRVLIFVFLFCVIWNAFQ